VKNFNESELGLINNTILQLKESLDKLKQHRDIIQRQLVSRGVVPKHTVDISYHETLMDINIKELEKQINK